MSKSFDNITNDLPGRVAAIADGVEVKKLNVEVEKDGKTYKVDVGSDKASAEVK